MYTVDSAVQEYLRPGNIRTPSYFSSKLNMNTVDFVGLIEEQKQRNFHMQQESAKGLPVMAQALQKASEAAKEAMEEEEEKKTRRYMTPETKELIIKDVLQGHSYSSVAALDDVGEPAVSRVMKKYREDNANANPANPANLAKAAQSLLADATEIGVSIEGDFFILKIPKNRLTRELLKGVL